MKKVILGLLALTLFIGTTTAQSPADLISKAKKTVKNISGKKEKVKEAEDAVAAMMQASENKTNAEALMWQGKFYNELASIDNLERTKMQLLGKQYKTEFKKSGLMASAALMAAAKATEDKKLMKDILASLSEAQSNVNNYGSDLTDAKDYISAYNSFKAVLDIHEVLKANGSKSTMDKTEDYNKQL